MKRPPKPYISPKDRKKYDYVWRNGIWILYVKIPPLTGATN